MTMTKKDFKIIAEALKHSKADPKVIDAVAESLGRNFALFDTSRFLAEAGYYEHLAMA